MPDFVDIIKCLKCGNRIPSSEWNWDEIAGGKYITCPKCEAKLLDGEWLFITPHEQREEANKPMPDFPECNSCQCPRCALRGKGAPGCGVFEGTSWCDLCKKGDYPEGVEGCPSYLSAGVHAGQMTLTPRSSE